MASYKQKRNVIKLADHQKKNTSVIYLMAMYQSTEFQVTHTVNHNMAS